VAFAEGNYREGEALPRYRPLPRLEQSRGLDVPFGCGGLLLFFAAVLWPLIARTRIPAMALLAAAAWFGLRGLVRVMRWRGVAVELAIDGDALVVGQSTNARLRLLGRKPAARINVWLAGLPAMDGNIKYRFIRRNHPLATVTDLGRSDRDDDSRELALTVPDDIGVDGYARWELLVEVDDLRGAPLFAAKFAVPVITRDGS
jgi:hypothetical protein